MKKSDIRILVACEESDQVRGRLEKMGFSAMSCDLQPSRNPSAWHYQGDVFDVINDGWDAMIGFPPCTHLACSGAAHFAKKREDGRQEAAIYFFLRLAHANIPYIALENPVGIMSSVWRKPDQIIQPYFFGDQAQKTTCLWLKGFPQLMHHRQDNLFGKKTHVYRGEDIAYGNGKKMSDWYYATSCLPPKERAKVRSKTFDGIADAMATQWGSHLYQVLQKKN